MWVADFLVASWLGVHRQLYLTQAKNLLRGVMVLV